MNCQECKRERRYQRARRAILRLQIYLAIRHLRGWKSLAELRRKLFNIKNNPPALKAWARKAKAVIGGINE